MVKYTIGGFMMFKLLLVDDNEMDKKYIMKLIKWEKLQVEVIATASNGEEGYEKALELKPDFILTDIAMPICNGIDMTEKIKKVLPKCKFIFMSCFDDFQFAKSAIKLDVNCYVLKPIMIDELTEAIEKIVEEEVNELHRENNDEEMKRILSENMSLFQEQFVKDLLYGKIKTIEEIESRRNFIMENFNKKYFTIVYFEIDNYELDYSKIPIEAKYILLENIKSSIKDVLLKELSGYCTPQENNGLCVLVFEDDITVYNHIIELCQLCKDDINSRYGINTTIGIGDISNNILDISKIYKNAVKAVKSKFFSHGNSIILVKEIVEEEEVATYDLNQLKEELSLIIDKDYEIDSFVKTKYRFTNSPQYIKSLSFSIVNMLQILLLEKNITLKDIFKYEGEIWGKLSKYETIEDIKKYIIKIIKEIKEYLASCEDKRFQKLVEDIKNIIHDKYAQIENINQIVEPLYISTNYANLKFKEYTDKTIFDYLVCTRIEKAKELLMIPHLKLYEISEKIGYKSTIYFTQVFKNYTGITPKEYRNKFIK